MRKFWIISLVIAVCASTSFAQAKSRPKTSSKPAAARTKPADKTVIADDAKGSVSGRTYSNRKFGFEITFPDTWLIPGDDFEQFMKSQGFDLTLKAPDSLTASGKAKVNAALKKVTMLVTAFRSMPGTADNAIMRVSAEDLTAQPQIKDAVDYFDAMRSSLKTLKLPLDFHYSDTQAEKLGPMQFAYLDTSSSAGKKRMYATVRKGSAILFTLSYSLPEDLAAMRRVLEEGNFDLK